MRAIPIVLALVVASFVPASSAKGPVASGPVFLEEYKVTALESEVAGIYPHPTDDALFLVAANGRPAYGAKQKPAMPAQYRGMLLTMNRHTGAVVSAFDLGGVNYGGIAYAAGALFVSSLEPPEILKVDLEGRKILRRIPLSGPAGGLEYDTSRGRLLAQLYAGFPHIAVVDPATGATIDTLPSDESAMDLAVVDGDLLCTWASSFDAQAFGELRRIDPATGKVTGRVPLKRVHSSMAPLNRAVNGTDGFISLVRADDDSGRVTVFKYAYSRATASW